MSIFKTRQNKKFDYQPRFYKGEGNPYEIKNRFDDFRKATAGTRGLKNKINNALDDYQHNPDRDANRRVLIIIAVLVLLFLLLIGFDLSIFFS